MDNQNKIRWALGVSALVVLTLLAVAIGVSPFIGLAQGQGGIAYDQSQASYFSPLVIPAADFSSDGVVPDGFFFWSSRGYLEGPESGTPPSANPVCLIAPAYLPNGVTVTNLVAYIYDDDDDYIIDLGLYRVTNTTLFPTSADEMAAVNSFGRQSSIQIQELSSSIEPGTETVSYPDYSYYISTCVESAKTRLYSVQLDYTP